MLLRGNSIKHQLHQMDPLRLESQLLQLLDKLFQKQYLEKNIYIFNQMKHNLEIPVSLVYKERKILQLTSDESFILQTLKKSSRVTVNADNRTLRVNIPLTKTKLVVQADKVVLEAIPRIAEQTLYNGYRWEVEKTNAVVNANDESQLLAFKQMLEAETKSSCAVENSDPYLDLKDSVEKTKQLKKERTSYTGYESYPAWSNSLYTYNPYAGRFEKARGPGFIRRAVETDEEEQDEVKELKEVETISPGKEKNQEKQQKEEGEQPNDHSKNKQDKDKRPKYREKQSKHSSKQHEEPMVGRIRFNSQNFPQIQQSDEIEREVLKIRYTKGDIVQVYTKFAPNVPISPELQKSGIPLLNLEGIFKLEAMGPGGRKESTFESVMIVPRKLSTTN